MPQIPTSNGPQVASRALPTPMRRDAAWAPDTTALSAVQGVESAAKALVGLGLQEKERADTTLALQSEAELDEARLTAEAKFGALKGERALVAYEDTLKQLEDRRSEILQRLKNERQRELFDQRTRGAVLHTRVNMQRHFASQSDAVDQQAFTSLSASKLKVIKASYADDETYRREVASMAGPLALEVRRQGVSTDRDPNDPKDRSAAVLAWEDFVSRAAESRLQGYLEANDGRGARAFFEANRTQLGERGKQYAGQLQKMGLAEQADTAVQQMLAAHRREGSNFLDVPGFTGALLDFKGPTELRDAVQDRGRAAIGLENSARSEQVGQVYGRALTDYLKGGQRLSAISPADADWLENHAPEKWQSLLKDSEARAERWRQRQKEDDKPGRTREQEVALGELMNRMLLRPEDFEGKTVAQFVTENADPLNPKDVQRAVAEFNRTQERWAKRDVVKETEFRKRVDAVLLSSPDHVKKGKLNDLGIRAQAALFAWRWEMLENPDTKREPTRAEVDAQLAKALTVGKYRGPLGISWDAYRHEEKDGWEEGTAEDQTVPMVRERMKGAPKPDDGSPAAATDAKAGSKPKGPATEIRQVRTVEEIPPDARKQLLASYRAKVGDPAATPPPEELLTRYNRGLVKGTFK